MKLGTKSNTVGERCRRRSRLRLSVLVGLFGLPLFSGNVWASPTDTVADLVLGQPDFTTGTCNTGGLSANSICFPDSVAVDDGGNVYVADNSNHRVLVYFSPLTTDKLADLVIGQPDFTTVGCNTGGVSASSLCFPEHLALDTAGNLYVADQLNHRVLVFQTFNYRQGGRSCDWPAKFSHKYREYGRSKC
jgi:DNA-binding beta-propeller fold protein YncE